MIDLESISWIQWTVFSASSFVLLLSAFTIYKIHCANSWPTTEGTVVSSGIVETHDDGPMYSASVEYSYIVDGVTRTGSRFCLTQGMSVSLKDLVTDPAAEYPVGKKVAVLYNPHRPSESLLTSAQVRGYWHYFVLLIPFAGYALLFVLK